MNPRTPYALCVACLISLLTLAPRQARGQSQDPRLVFNDPTGVIQTITTAPSYDANSFFFQSLGTNGRSCSSCHQAQAGFTLTPALVQSIFDGSDGLDPLFAPVDGTNSPNAPMATVEDRLAATTMIRSRAVIRIEIGIPANAEFALAAVDDPYHFASASQLSLFRRPLPTTNLKFLSTVMWDGRETVPGATILSDLGQQAIDATRGHAQAPAPGLTPAEVQDIVSFETGLFTAQVQDQSVGTLAEAGAQGGPLSLSQQDFYLGINDALGGDPMGAAFNPEVFTLYAAWSGTTPPGRQEVALGEAIFNLRGLTITGVKGLNDALGVPSIQATCSTCHDSPNAGDHSVSLPLDLGLTDASRRTPDMPLYTLRNLSTGETLQTTDPGRALITGKWRDIGKFKGPILRGLAGRAPYFHNGSAASLSDVVDFYDQRFGANFTPDEKQALVAFLQTL